MVSCKVDKPEKQISYLQLKLEGKMGSSPLTFNQTLTNSLGFDYNFTRCVLYMSNFQIDTSKIAHSYVFINGNDLDQTPFEVFPGSYDSLIFMSGLDSVSNHSDPSVHPEGHPLELKNPSTHWNWASGYLMIILEGNFDSDGNGSLDQNFIYHIGGPKVPKNFTENLTLRFATGETTEVTLTIDWAKFLENMDFPNEQSSHMPGPIATKIADQSHAAISVH